MLTLLVLLAQATEPDPDLADPAPDPQEVGEPDGVFGGTLFGDGESLIGALGSLEAVGAALDTAQVSVDWDDDADVMVVRNGKAYPITFAIDLTLAKNVVTAPRFPVELRLDPGESETLRFLPTQTLEVMDYAFRWHWVAGSSKAKHRPEGLYRLPWDDGLAFECSQGFDGEFSHDETHAVDIAMPVGTRVRAARGGRVISIVDGWGEGGHGDEYLDKANSVLILHADGTMGSYVHLEAGGMEVSIGDTVAAGDPIGRSGNSGYTRGPHLHFVVKSALDGFVSRTHPMRFDVGGEGLILDPGRLYPVGELVP